jgi:hypothetical protein
MATRLFGWWRFAEDALSLLSKPRTDVARSDAAAEQVFRGSVLVSGVRNMISGGDWATSRVVAIVRSLLTPLAPSRHAMRVRAAGLIAVVASIMALGARAVEPVSPGPLTWIVPAVCAGVGLVIMAAANPLARAMEDKSR